MAVSKTAVSTESRTRETPRSVDAIVTIKEAILQIIHFPDRPPAPKTDVAERSNPDRPTR